jgi:hypothetical protein
MRLWSLTLIVVCLTPGAIALVRDLRSSRRRGREAAGVAGTAGAPRGVRQPSAGVLATESEAA